MALAPRFFNGDVAQMVEHSLCMREVRGSLPRNLQFFRGARKSKTEIREAVLLDQKKTWICTSIMQKEASETDVKGNITLTHKWIKDIPLT